MKTHQPLIYKTSLVAGIFLVMISITPSKAQELNNQVSNISGPCSISTLKIEKGNLTPLSNALDCLYDAYLESGYEYIDRFERQKNPSSKLIWLDTQVQRLVEEVHKIEPKDLWVAAWDDKYKQLGLFSSTELGYTGKLGKEAHGISDGRTDAAFADNPEGILKMERDALAKLKSQLAPFIEEYIKIEQMPADDPAKIERLFILDDKVRHFSNDEGIFCGVTGQYTFEGVGIQTAEGKTWYWGKLFMEAEQLASTEQSNQPIRIITTHGAITKNLVLRNLLAQIYNEYIEIKNNPSATKRLVEIDSHLYEVVKKVVEYAPLDQSKAFWREDYRQIGLSIGHYSEQLEYDGGLVRIAHMLNPNSRLREDTLFAYVFRNDSRYGGPPDPSELAAYLKEFPNNKYTLTIYDNFADFYHGLYTYLKYGAKGRYTPEAKDECYKAYVTDKAIQTQATQAQQQSITFLEKLIRQTEGSVRRDYEKKLEFVKSGEYKEEDAWCDVMD